MKLTGIQKSQLRKIIELSTVLQDVRLNISDRWREARDRLNKAKHEQKKAAEDLAAAERWANSTAFARPEDREMALKNLKDKNDLLRDRISNLGTHVEQLDQQLESMSPDVNCASRLSAQLLDYSGIDGNEFEPIVRIGTSIGLAG